MLGNVRTTAVGILVVLSVSGACAKSDARFTEELSDRDPFVRAMAAIALVEQAPERSQRALPILLETVDRSELRLQPQASAALAKAGARLVPELLASLARDEFMTLERRAAVQSALVAAGEPAIPSIVQAMREQESFRRRELGLVLARIGHPSVGPLVQILSKDPDASMRGAAALVLAEIGTPARNALSALTLALANDVGAVALAAAHAMPRIDPGGTVVLPALQAALSRPELEIREAAGAGIARIGTGRASLLQGSPDGDPRNRRGPER
jgi:HEAT repeat protein